MPRPSSPRSSMSTESSFANEDLKAFERRLAEVISSMRPRTQVFRWMLALNFIIVFFSGINWILDPATFEIPLAQSLYYNHFYFILSSAILVTMIIFGVHRRVVAPQMIVSRVRCVLADFNMSCDDNGRLILNPRPLVLRDTRPSLGTPTITPSP